MPRRAAWVATRAGVLGSRARSWAATAESSLAATTHVSRSTRNAERNDAWRSIIAPAFSTSANAGPCVASGEEGESRVSA